MIRIAAVTLLYAMGISAVSVVYAQGSYPNRPIRWIIPYAPGGGTDVIARPIALKLGEVFGQPIDPELPKDAVVVGEDLGGHVLRFAELLG